jgi:outer membrane protein assembly factor BamD (BamD/ComL family)
VNSTIASETSFDVSNWYFGNLSAVALGQSEFVRIWGNMPLEDNWRRSSRTTAASRARENIPITETQPVDPVEAVTVVLDPVEVEFQKIEKQLPRTEEQVSEALHKIEGAYFRLGDIYYFDLQEKENAVSSYETLLSRFPETEFRPEALYKLYLIFKSSDAARSERYAAELKEKFPESSYAKILVNPNYLQESELVVSKQKSIYKEAYKEFETGNYSASFQLIQSALAMENTSFTPTLELLAVLIVGRTENISQYQLALDQFIKNNPEGEVTNYAKKLLGASRDFQLNQEKAKGIQYIQSLEEPHYFVLVSVREENKGVPFSRVLETFNEKDFKDLNLKVSNLILNDSYTLTLVADLPRISSAIEYYKTFTEKVSSFTELKNHKFNSFVITKDNFDIFYRTKGLDEYLRFFQKNYHPENP